MAGEPTIPTAAFAYRNHICHPPDAFDMSGADTRRWETLERWRAKAFLIGGAIFLADVALVASHAASGTEPGAFGQALVGAAWTASFVGLLGTYPSLAGRSRWLPRVGAASAAVGGVTMAAMAVTSFAYFAGIPNGELGDVVFFFLPGVFVGIVLGFGSFGVLSLRTDVYSRSVGLLFLLLVVTFLFNLGSGIAGFATITTVLGVVFVLAVSKLALGYLFQTGAALARRDGVQATTDRLS